MGTWFRSLGSLALLTSGAEGARIARKRVAKPTKFIAGVPVLNYHTAYEGEPTLVEGEREGEWVVMAEPGTSNAQIQKLCQAARKGCKLAGHGSGVPFFELRGTERDLEAVISAAKGIVKYIEPDQTVQMIPEIEAPELEAQLFDMFRSKQTPWGLKRIGADKRSHAGSGTTVFVLDTGVRVSHQDFGGRAAPELDLTRGYAQKCNGDHSCAKDMQGHGTHCAGTAAGKSFGVAPGAAVRSVKVLGDQGQGSWSWTYYGLDYLATLPVRPVVASMSLGGKGVQQAMEDSVTGAVDAGVIVVVAAGNDNSNACRFSPAFVPAAITVGSTDSVLIRSYFSNYGGCTDIWAPGSSIVSASHRSDSDKATLSGTSMACPHVAGAAAVVLEKDPSMNAAEVLKALLAKAKKDAISDLRSDDTNSFLYIGDKSSSVLSALSPLVLAAAVAWQAGL